MTKKEWSFMFPRGVCTVDVYISNIHIKRNNGLL